jgi:hemolysin activation/secretion protein
MRKVCLVFYEFAGDMGYYTSFEWSFPFYILPKDIRVPFTKDILYDAFRIVLFYDWGTVHRERVAVGAQKHDTLKSCGFGFRLNLTNDVSARVEFGYPLGEDSSDGHNMQRWVEVVAKF